MEGKRIGYVSAALVVFLATAGLSLESPAVSSPVGSGTVPPTTYRQGLVPSVNPIDSSGNLVVTGNVAGGSYFRGVVPYGGVTDFSAATGTLGNTSGAFDSFLRRTSGSQGLERSGGGLTPFYSPTQTVTTQMPGTRGGVMSQAAGGYAGDSFYGAVLPSGQTGIYRQGYVPQVKTRPLSMSQLEMEKLVQDDVKRYPMGGEPVTEVQSLEQFWRQMGIQIERKQESAKGGLTEEVLGAGTETDVRTLLGFKMGGEGPAAEESPENSGMTGVSEAPDVYEQMKKQLFVPAAGAEGLPAGTGKPATEQTPRPGSGQAEPNKPTSGGLTIGAAGVYKSFAVFRDDKFNQHIRAAESYMKQGRFYRAADAYTLATAYKPDDPLGYAGKSIALFATGEYMSSSLFLARALVIFPEYAKVRIDFVGMTGDKDTVENRILDAREWTTRSDSGELEFLLSYVYYQMDRMEFARVMIESAETKMPDSAAVAAMKKAIDERLAKP